MTWPEACNASLKEMDPEVYEIIEKEKARQWKAGPDLAAHPPARHPPRLTEGHQRNRGRERVYPYPYHPYRIVATFAVLFIASHAR